MDDELMLPVMSRETVKACAMGMKTAIVAAEMAVRNAPPGATRAEIIEVIRNLKITEVPRAR